jgi:hypothetical protein
LQKGGIPLFILLLMGLIIFASFVVVNGFPSTIASNAGTPVQIILNKIDSAKNTLQLYLFNGATLTPAPSAAITSCNNNFDNDLVEQKYYMLMKSVSNNEKAIKVFYGDEWPLTLGSGTVSPMNQRPADHVTNPNVGDQTARDPDSLAYFPAVYLTDITANRNDKSGDAENNGIPIIPNDIYGAWQSYPPPSGGSSFSENNGNGLNVGFGADPLPTSNGPKNNGDHGAQVDPATMWSVEIIWKLSSLKLNNQPLQAGHLYRAEFVIHDGDTKHSPDVGEGCVTLQI